MYVHVSTYRGARRVRIVEKENKGGWWSTKLVKHIGTARNDDELEILKKIAETHKAKLVQGNQLSFDFGQLDKRGLYTLGTFYHGAELILGGIFDSLSLSLSRHTQLLRLLSIARIVNPGSKRNTANWLQDTLGSAYSLDQIYRFLDTIFKNKSKIKRSLRNYVIKNYPGHLSYLIYDVTTLYFEIDKEDDESNDQLRKRGYSKDHRFDQPQVVLGLCVNEAGMPLDYKLYSGNTYEGKTLVDAVEFAKTQLEDKPITVVADAGMLSFSNISLIKERQMNFIISARIKNLDKELTDRILQHDFLKNPTYETRYKDDRLIVTYSKKRANADKKRRQASIARLEKLIAKNRAVRKHQFLLFSVNSKPTLNYEAIEHASKFDGLKGYLTNNYDLSADSVISHYNQLPIVEQTFRMTKSDLKIRPSYHQRARRIEAHVLLCMISLCIMRILENKVKKCGLTLHQALEIINKTNAAIIGSGKKSYTVPPLYSAEFEAIKAAVEK